MRAAIVNSLSQDEIELVLKHREKMMAQASVLEKQTNCAHEWLFVGGGHSKDIYECRLCSKLKFE